MTDPAETLRLHAAAAAGRLSQSVTQPLSTLSRPEDAPLHAALAEAAAALSAVRHQLTREESPTS